MSHNVMVKNVKIADLNSLRAAINELKNEGVKISLAEDQKTFRTYKGQPNKCDMVIKLEGERYDVGLKLEADGTYSTVFESMLGSNKSVACAWNAGDPREMHYDPRAPIGRLLQRYTVVTAERDAATKGYSCTRENNVETGDMQVVVAVAN